MTNWTWNSGGSLHRSYSPIKLSSSKPTWVLAADLLVRVNNGWGNGGGPTGLPLYAWDDLPPHRDGMSKAPAGGNEVFGDGSAGWYRYQTMSLFTSYPGATGNRQFFWYQDSADFDQPLLNALPSLSAKNFP